MFMGPPSAVGAEVVAVCGGALYDFLNVTHEKSVTGSISGIQ